MIGKGAVVATGSLVTRDVEPPGVVGGGRQPSEPAASRESPERA